jgi:hypothetical protein
LIVSVLSDAERRFLEEHNARRVRYLGRARGDRFDIMNWMSGLGQFDDEYAAAIVAHIDGVQVRVPPLTRILASKRAADRPKDRAVIPALEEASPRSRTQPSWMTKRECAPVVVDAG